MSLVQENVKVRQVPTFKWWQKMTSFVFQVQSLMRVTRYALFLDRLFLRDSSDSVNEEELEAVYLMAKETVGQDELLPSFHTVKFSSSNRDSLPSGSSKNPIVILIHPTGSPTSGIRILEQRSASADLELLMREEDMKADENIDISNIDWKNSPKVRRSETVIKHQTGPFPDKCY